MEPKRILIWEQNWLGDVLFSTPFIRAVKNRFKDAYIAAIVKSSCREILEGNPHLNEIILYDEKGSDRGFLKRIKFILGLRRRNFDACFLLHRSFTRALMAMLAGVKKRIGYHYMKRNLLLTDIVEAPDSPVHKIEYFLKIAGYAGADTRNKAVAFYVDEKSRKSLEALLSRNGVQKKDPVMVINPGGNWPPKTWTEKNFSELADALKEAYNARVVLTGAEKDFSKALRIQEAAKNKIIIICGKTTLKELGALFERARAVISGDSGPLHVALAVGAKTVALFGPTSPDLTGPYGKGNYKIIQKNTGCSIPCYEVDCPDNKCMKAITVDDVMAAVKEIL